MTLTDVQALQREANFRYSLVRVRDNVESIAFYGGESHEAATIKVVQSFPAMWDVSFGPYFGLFLCTSELDQNSFNPEGPGFQGF